MQFTSLIFFLSFLTTTVRAVGRQKIVVNEDKDQGEKLLKVSPCPDIEIAPKATKLTSFHS